MDTITNQVWRVRVLARIPAVAAWQRERLGVRNDELCSCIPAYITHPHVPPSAPPEAFSVVFHDDWQRRSDVNLLFTAPALTEYTLCVWFTTRETEVGSSSKIVFLSVPFLPFSPLEFEHFLYTFPFLLSCLIPRNFRARFYPLGVERKRRPSLFLTQVHFVYRQERL